MTFGSRYPVGLDPSTQWRRSSGVQRSSFWPDADEELLLRAALTDGEHAARAIDAWQRTVDIDQISFGSYRLLPMLHSNAARLDIPLENAGIVSGIYRRSWYRNSILLDRAVPAVAALTEAGIEMMLLKGAALTLVYYDDRGVRPLGDIDILVRRVDAQRALDVLAKHGWTSPHDRMLPGLSPAWLLKHPSGGVIDLHRMPGFEYVAPATESALWEASRRTDLGGAPTFVETPEDLLVHVFVHGIAPRGAIRWVADAFTIITQSHDLDWDRFGAQILERRVAHRVHEGLEYVANTFDVPIPKEVRRRLRERSPSGWERREFVANKRWTPGSVVWDSARMWYWYRRRCAIEDQRAHPWGFLRVVAEASGRSRGDVIRAAVRSARRRLREHADAQ